jgi:hypothetical protein
MHQGFCHTQNKQICNNEKNDPNTKKLNQKANAKKEKTKLNKEIITKLTNLRFF